MSDADPRVRAAFDANRADAVRRNAEVTADLLDARRAAAEAQRAITERARTRRREVADALRHSTPRAAQPGVYSFGAPDDTEPVAPPPVPDAFAPVADDDEDFSDQTWLR